MALAASFISPLDDQSAHSLQRIEVRAFGLLLEELLQRYNTTREPSIEDATTLKTLAELQTRCAHPHPATRPLFEEISHILGAI